jgi:tetratricopeptide (TPR) repeat protein/predicted Ser/Thr protein kinase
VDSALGQNVKVGQVLGHYRVAEKIGAGGMGEVYRCHDEHLDREVAIKVLPPGTLADERSRKRFRKEALTLSKLNHPNIATIHDFDTQQGIDFLVMEYIPGITLSDKIAGRPLPEKEVVSLGTQLAEGLSAAHERGVVHRDLKPQNLRLTSDGRLKILDFGLAKLQPALTANALTESLSGAEGLSGTLLYMAPEQILGEEVDQRTDIHAAGVVLFEMATGKQPFLEFERSQIIGAILRKSPRAVSTLNPKMPSELERIIGKCLEKDPGSRYQRAAELAIDLQRMARADVPLAAPVPRHPVRSAMIAFFAAVLILFAAFLALPTIRRYIMGHTVAAGHQTPGRTGAAVTPINEKDYILVSDFNNRTGDPVFDATLRKAAALDLDQSPYLNVVSDRRVAEALERMGRNPGEKLTPELATDLCKRNGIKALLVGSVDAIGNNFLISMQVIDAASGEVLTEDHRQANGKEQVLSQMDQAGAELRKGLGESLPSMQKFDTPLPEATTRSLEALRAFALGDEKHFSGYDIEAIGFYQHALELDPNFALAWARLASVYGNLDDQADAQDAAQHAYRLKDHVSERERLYILAKSSDLTTKRTALELYRNTFPRDPNPWVNLSELDTNEQAEKDLLEALRLDPGVVVAYGDLAGVYAERGNTAKAMATCRDGLSRVSGSPILAGQCYEIALAAQDQAGLQEIAATLKGRAEGRIFLAQMERDRAFAQGQMQRSSAQNESLLEAFRDYQLPSIVLSSQLPYLRLQVAAGYKVDVSEQLRANPGLAARSLPALLASAEAGKPEVTARTISEALKNGKDAYASYVNALVAFRRGQLPRAQALLSNTKDLRDPFVLWYRGSIFLRSHQITQATVDFEKLLGGAKPSAPLYPWAAFAHIGLARCLAEEGKKPEARTEYEKAFAVWKDADPDIPLLQEARAEYAKLH